MTPVSALQEYLQRLHKPLPQYTEIPVVYTITPIFNVRCQCEGLTVHGEASNKKTAKQQAAVAMLKLLKVFCSTYNESSDSSSCSPPTSRETPVPVKTTPISPATPSTTPDPMVNYIGQLNELCICKKLLAPVYSVVQTFGPSHLPMFMIECKIGTLAVSATEATKKRAKKNAAAAMLELLNKEYNLVNKTEDLVPVSSNLEELVLPMEHLKIQESSQLATATNRSKELYSKLSKIATTIPINPKEISIANYHEAFKASFSVPVLERFHTYYESASVEDTDSKVNLEAIFQKICDILSLTYEKQVLKVKYNEIPEPYLVAYHFKSTISFAEIGIGANLEEAHVNAIKRIISLIHLLLI